MQSESDDSAPVAIIGAGLAGLACARTLHRSQKPFIVLEASDRVGGRVATDQQDGFLLDRGFQVFLTAYPEASQVLAYRGLQLHPFYPGALVQVGPRRYRFADPWRKPLSSLAGLLAPIATVADGWRIAGLRRSALREPDPASCPDTPPTCDYLAGHGLSTRVIERFFRPFFGGVFLDRELRTPSTFFRFVFAMFARGPAALPAGGMQALPQQIAASLPVDTVRLNTRVHRVEPHAVHLTSGETLPARAVVVATDGDDAGDLISSIAPLQWNSTTTLYYAAPQSPVQENILVLNGNGSGLVNHVCVPSDVSETYAPPGQALISVSIIGLPEDDDTNLDRRVIAELRSWFGSAVDAWQRLRVYRIAHALPRRQAGDRCGTVRSDGFFVCGDHVQDPSINGALLSGRLAAEAVLASVPG